MKTFGARFSEDLYLGVVYDEETETGVITRLTKTEEGAEVEDTADFDLSGE